MTPEQHKTVLQALNSLLSEMADRNPMMGFDEYDSQAVKDARAAIVIMEAEPQGKPSKMAFEHYWVKTRGGKKSRYELQPHPLQPQVYKTDSANRHWVTWQAAQAALKPVHDSDCALHNAPAYPMGPCDCSVAAPKYPS